MPFMLIYYLAEVIWLMLNAAVWLVVFWMLWLYWNLLRRLQRANRRLNELSRIMAARPALGPDY